MDEETVKAEMLKQLKEAQESKMNSVFGWVFEVEDLVIYTRLRHRRNQKKEFLLKTTFDDFPRRAPSYSFIDPKTRQEELDAWPPNVKHGGSPPGICTTGTRECHEHYHRNDAQYSWDPAKYTFLSTLAEIHRMMEKGIG